MTPQVKAMLAGGLIGLILGIGVSLATGLPFAPEGGLILGLLAGYLSARR